MASKPTVKKAKAIGTTATAVSTEPSILPPAGEQAPPETPPTAAVEAEPPKVEEKQDFFQIHHFKCLRCLHLAPTLPKVKGGDVKAFKDCHFSARNEDFPNGNDNCPARLTRIIVGINVESIAKSYAKALKNNDVGRMTRLNERLASKDPVLVQRVFALVQQLVRDSSA